MGAAYFCGGIAMQTQDLVVIGNKAFVISDINGPKVHLVPLSITDEEMVVHKERILAIGIYRRVE